MDNDINDLILRDTSSHEFSGMPHAPGNMHQVQSFEKHLGQTKALTPEQAAIARNQMPDQLKEVVKESVMNKENIVKQDNLPNLAGD